MEKHNIKLSGKYGSIKYVEGTYELIFERKITHSASKIWTALTDPEKLRLWLSPNLETERSELHLIPGGKVRLQLMMAAPQGVISRIEKEKILEIDWGQGNLNRWEIHEEGKDCRLLFTERLPGSISPTAATAWHAYIDFLETSLDGGVIPANVVQEWKHLSAEHQEVYTQILKEATKKEDPNGVFVTVCRQFTVPPSRVFDAWITPTAISSFMFGPQVRDESIVHLKVDAHLGGKFSFAVTRAGEMIDHIGEYRVFDYPENLVFTWGIAGESDGESVVTIVILPNKKGCTLILTHQLDPAWKDFADRTKKGWSFMIDKLIDVMETEKNTPHVTAQMMIRKPVSVVFEAFVDPEITRNFWFTKGSGKLEANKTVTWEWDMYGISTEVKVMEIILEKRILIQWGEPATDIDFQFQELSDGYTYVTITNTGFTQQGDELLAAINDNTGGFTTVLDGAKAYLEYNINLNLIADKFPKEVSQHSK